MTARLAFRLAPLARRPPAHASNHHSKRLCVSNPGGAIRKAPISAANPALAHHMIAELEKSVRPRSSA